MNRIKDTVEHIEDELTEHDARWALRALRAGETVGVGHADQVPNRVYRIHGQELQFRFTSNTTWHKSTHDDPWTLLRSFGKSVRFTREPNER